MKIAALTGQRKFEIEEAERPSPGPGEIRLKVAACGVCTSELHMWLPERNLQEPEYHGHEASGTVLETGSGVDTDDFKPGDRVVVYPYRSRGFAEELCVPVRYAVKLADHVPFEHALGEPIGCAVNAVNRSRIELGDTVVLIGLGFMGSLVLQGSRLRGAGRIIAVDSRDEVLDLARELGADIVIHAGRENVAAKVRELTGGEGADVVIEATGSEGALNTAAECVRVRGTLVIVGYHQIGRRSVDMQLWNYKGLDVVNAHERDWDIYMSGIRIGMDLLASGRLKMSPLVTHRFPLDRINEAFETAAAKPPGFVKAVIVNP
ncbi:zinc-binding dehydrogenase [Cohnella sp. GCM10027633]|uniref:MDR/zinc-dependent alcohol dehydrogenase-like family protein n=1 Tax=unclassified Cohnella TaxID=2636738 RepID=UPI00363D59B0